jgi:ATP-dependent Clp protease ATP-binding subunit ClpA
LKTAIARGIARRIADGTVPRALLSKAVYVLDIATMLENTGIRGSLESKLKEIVTAATRTKDILFIDEIHTIVGGGSGEIANILKPPLADGSISVVGATTLTEYTRYIESDSALERRFLMVEVVEPTVKEAVNVLNGLSSLYEKHHNVVIPAGSTDTVASLSKRYLTGRHLPDSAIDVLDMACVNAIDRTQALGGTTISQEEWRSLVDKRDFLGAARSKPRYRIGKMSDAVLKEEDIER